MSTFADRVLTTTPSADDIDGWMLCHEMAVQRLKELTPWHREWVQKHLELPIYGDLPLYFYDTSRGIHVFTRNSLKYRPWPKRLGCNRVLGQ